jgi:hypothetical protein
MNDLEEASRVSLSQHVVERGSRASLLKGDNTLPVSEFVTSTTAARGHVVNHYIRGSTPHDGRRLPAERLPSLLVVPTEATTVSIPASLSSTNASTRGPYVRQSQRHYQQELRKDATVAPSADARIAEFPCTLANATPPTNAIRGSSYAISTENRIKNGLKLPMLHKMSSDLPVIDNTVSGEEFFRRLESNRHILGYTEREFFCICVHQPGVRKPNRGNAGFSHLKSTGADKAKNPYNPFTWAQHALRCRYLQVSLSAVVIAGCH